MASEGIVKRGPSCTVCKSKKRRCDRADPKCSTCVKLGLACEFPSPFQRSRQLSQPQQPRKQPQSRRHPSPQIPTPTPARTRTPSASTASLPSSASTAEFPAVFYLDNSVFRRSLVPKPSLSCLIPPSVTSIIGDASKWASIAAEYFKTVHTWMPIVSKKRFFENVPSLEAASGQLRSDYALLVLCMELSMWMPQEQNPRTQAYLAAKSFYLDLEIQGIVSIQVLQALVLMALYETGHAIFPSAAVSVEACVRYGQALGINWDAKDHEKKPFAWVDREEQNRVWWGVFMLDWCAFPDISKASD